MATSAERVRRALRYDRINRAIERPFRREIMGLKNRYIDDQLAFYKKNGRLSTDLTNTLSGKMEKVFEKYQGMAIRMAGAETLKQVSVPKSTKPFELKAASRWDHYLRVWASTNGGKNARATAGTTFTDLSRLITAAFTAGEDESAVIRAGLRAKGYSAFRADTVARTETHNAATFAAERTTEDLAAEVGVTMLKIWQPVLDERTRESHAAMINHPAIGMSEYFDVGGVEMDRPGDDDAPAEEVINCRCVCLYESA